MSPRTVRPCSRPSPRSTPNDWLQAIVTNPVGNEWLERIKEEHPDAFETWFTQSQYEAGGEEGS